MTEHATTEQVAEELSIELPTPSVRERPAFAPVGGPWLLLCVVLIFGGVALAVLAAHSTEHWPVAPAIAAIVIGVLDRKSVV